MVHAAFSDPQPCQMVFFQPAGGLEPQQFFAAPMMQPCQLVQPTGGAVHHHLYILPPSSPAKEPPQQQMQPPVYQLQPPQQQFGVHAVVLPPQQRIPQPVYQLQSLEQQFCVYPTVLPQQPPPQQMQQPVHQLQHPMVLPQLPPPQQMQQPVHQLQSPEQQFRVYPTVLPQQPSPQQMQQPVHQLSAQTNGATSGYAPTAMLLFQPPRALPDSVGYYSGDAQPNVGGDFGWTHDGWMQEEGLEVDAASEDAARWAPPVAARNGSARRGGGVSGKRRRERRQCAAERADEVATGPAADALCGVDGWQDCVGRLKAALSAPAGSEARAWAVGVLLTEQPNIVARLAFEPVGSRVVQDALVTLDHCTASAVAEKLRGHVCRAAKSPHANHVVQKIIQTLPIEAFRFVMQELSNAPVSHARHEYGCRILCSLLQHAATHTDTERLMEPVIAEAQTLCWHKFGHHVMELALEHGTPEQRHGVAAALLDDTSLALAFHRNAVFVFEKALLRASEQDAAAIVGLLLAEPQRFLDLARGQHSHIVVRALLRSPGSPAGQAAAELLRGAAGDLLQDKHGRRVVQEHALLLQGTAVAATGA